jgi:hypothetical protein
MAGEVCAWRLRLLIPLAASTVLAGCVTVSSTHHTVRVGDTRVTVRVQQRPPTTPTMINVHDDENTSVRAGTIVLRESGGRLVELVHSGRRQLAFQLDGSTYRFDPNRIFTEAGIRATLSRQGDYSEAAHRAVRDFAGRLLTDFALDQQPVIIALHNTGTGGLSINSYQPGHKLDRAAATVHVSTTRRPGDFFYVTNERFFAWLQARDFNVMLQDNANVPDDGSLSVYCAQRGIPYLNIEAHHDHLEEQVLMVRAAYEMLAELELTR